MTLLDRKLYIVLSFSCDYNDELNGRDKVMTASEIVDVNVNLSFKAMFDQVHKITNQIPELYPSMHIYSS